MRRALVLGRGLSGRAAEALAAKLGFAATVIDGNDPLPDGDFAFAVVSPGIASSHPWILACKERGIEVKSELQLGVEECLKRGVRLLAVTGSKGKSSVVKVVADALAAAGRRAVPCGNYGLPVCDVVLKGDVDWAVVEVSSFQLETTNLPADAFEAAVVLNLQEDHLDRHGNVGAYHSLKRRLLAMARAKLDPDGCAALVGGCSRLFRGSYFDNDVLCANGAAAVWLMRMAGLADDVIARAFADFKPLPHRMNVVGSFGGVKCIDDSKATSLAALAAGVCMAGEGIRLIAGGLAKGDDPKSVIPHLTRRVKKVYLIGHCAEVFSAAWSGSVDCEVCGTMERAVESAMRDAEKGDTLLLSPGTASFDQFQSFGQRGDVFAELVKKEGQKKK